MAIAFVNRNGEAFDASASSIVSAAQSLTAGNFLAVAYYIDDSTKTPSGVPTDTAGNTYVQCGTTQQGGGGMGNFAMFYCYNCLGNASNAITLNLSGSSAFRAVSHWQFSGVPTSDPKIAAGFGSGASGTSLTVSAAMSHGTGEAVFVALGVTFSSGTSGPSAGGSGYTFNAYSWVGGPVNGPGDEYKIASADDTPSMTATNTSIGWGLMAGSFGTPASASYRRLTLLGVGN